MPKQSIASKLVGRAVNALSNDTAIQRVVMSDKQHTAIAYHGDDAIIVVLKNSSKKELQAKLF